MIGGRSSGVRASRSICPLLVAAVSGARPTTTPEDGREACPNESAPLHSQRSATQQGGVVASRSLESVMWCARSWQCCRAARSCAAPAARCDGRMCAIPAGTIAPFMTRTATETVRTQPLSDRIADPASRTRTIDNAARAKVATFAARSSELRPPHPPNGLLQRQPKGSTAIAAAAV